MSLALVSHQNAAEMEPCPISELAAVMAEQMWVDMRVVPGGIAERVLVVAILIKRDGEQVQIEQWLRNETGDVDSRLHWLDAEDIWWIKPTHFECDDELTPFEPSAQPKLAVIDGAYDAAVAAVAHYFRVTSAEVDAIAKDRLDANHYRYWVMLVYDELVKAKPIEVTKLFGYQSLQPLVSARDHAKKCNGETRIPAMVKYAQGLL